MFTTNLSAFIRCLFLLGLAPDVLSRLSPESSLERARVKFSGSIPPTLEPRPLCRALLSLAPSPLFITWSVPRSDGGGGVAILDGVRTEGLIVS